PSATSLPFVLPSNFGAAAFSSLLALVDHTLDGAGHGKYTGDAVQSDRGLGFVLRGTANLAGMGHVAVHGSVHAVGFIQHGHAGGELTFSNSKGSVTVELTGPEQTAFSKLPTKFSYRVTGGTGSFASFSDHGSLSLFLRPSSDQTHPHGAFAFFL